MNILVASQNPVKLSATHNGFVQMFPGTELIVSGIDVPSGVSDQPMTDEETQQGAANRAKAALEARPTVDYAVGIEGGVEPFTEGGLSVFAWVVVLRQDGQPGRSKTGTFFLPHEVARLILDEGLELGDADDRVFGGENTKQKNGSVGLLTGDVLTRESFYTPAVIMALIPFKNPGLTFV